HVSKVSQLSDASFAYSSLSGWEEQGRLDGFLDLTREVWRTRAYGDFWPYMMVAEGAVDLCAEPELSLWDMAATSIVVTEAGGSFTGLDGRPGPHSGSAAASTGLLHDELLVYLNPRYCVSRGRRARPRRAARALLLTTPLPATLRVHPLVNL